MASMSLVAWLLLGVFLSAVVTDNHLTEAKRSRLYRVKRRPAPVVDPSGATITGNCPPPPSALHTSPSCGGDDFFKSCSIGCKDGYVFPGQTRHFKYQLTCDEADGFWEANGVKAAVPDCNPVCPVGCKNGGTCSAPDVCTCPPGWEGKDCGRPVKIQCQRIKTPFNAVASASGNEVGSTVTAICRDNYFFPGGRSQLTYECVRGKAAGSGIWHPIDGQGDGLPLDKFPPACLPAECDPDFCKNGGTCVGKNVCVCPPGTRGPQCEFLTKDCDCPEAPTGGSVKQTLTENGQTTVCEFSCNDGLVMSGTTTRFTCKRDGVWNPPASGFPRCSAPSTTPTPTSVTIPPVSPTPHGKDIDSDGFCYSFCQSSYRTFDSKKYDFNGKCSYVLAKDCQDDTFEIRVINDKLCDEGSDCHRTIVIKSGSATVILEYTLGRVKLSDNYNTLLIPYTVQNMEVNEVGDMVEVTNDLGFVLRWDKEQFVSVEITKDSLKGKMCGLCGDYDGYSTNDFAASIKGIERNTAMAFGLDNKVPGTEGCDDGAKSSYCSGDKEADAERYCKNLRNGNFSACVGVVNADDFKSACVQSVCRYGDAGSTESACCAFEALVRECVRQGGKGAGSWRTDDFCPALCPPGQIYDDCGPNCVKTCHNRKSRCTSTQCVEGCRCPDDKVLHNGECIDASKCPCVDGGEEYEEGSSLKRDCNTCTCKNGNWDCTTKKCDAICEGNGDPHYRTFDGKNYDFMGDCRYYLVKSDQITIIVENRKCGNQHAKVPLSCTKSLRIMVGTTDIKLLPGKAIQVGSETPHKVNEFRNSDVIYHSAGSIWEQLDVLNLGVSIQWDGMMAFKVIVPASFMGKTKGLCGTFNKKQTDDFLTPEGDIETSASRFGHKWRTEDCDGPVPPVPKCVEPALSAAKTTCDVLNGDAFKKCRAVVDVTSDIKNCITDHCFCGDEATKIKCICNDLRRYADTCRRKGHDVGDWRKNVPECAVTCPPGKIFKTCVDSCKDSCREISVGTDGCKEVCTEGCTCPDGKVENKDGQCVPVADCGCYYHGKDFAKGEKNVQTDENGRPKECTCVGPHWECKDIITCKPEKHEKFTNCMNKKCEPKCNNLKEDLVCANSYDCEPGCECADNYVRNSKGECVLVEQCECEHGGKIYPPGGSFKSDCETCTCENGRWNCDQCQCAGTCTAWGDSHYVTFDGKMFEFAGNCEYTLVALKNIEDTNIADFEVTVKNVPCGSSGVTCAKTVTLAVKIGSQWEKVVLTRDGGIKSSSDQVFEIRDVGLYKFINVKHNGITLLWDKGTILYVKLDADYADKIEGLCGDFNGNPDDDFHPRDGGSPIAEAHKFAAQWAVNPKCEAPTPDKPLQCATNDMQLWAKQKCGVMRGPLFSACRGLVDPEPFYERCVHDTCACDFGGDCECLCTAISVFASECAKAGAPVSWRSQELCPIQCPCRAENASSECPCYNPCVPVTPPENCDDPSRLDKNKESVCDQGGHQCVEGCFVECPPGFIRDRPGGRCIKKVECEGCGKKDGKLIKDGDTLEDPCCICTKTEDGKWEKKCIKDSSIRLSGKIPSKYKDQNEKIVDDLKICQNGIINGTVDSGDNTIRVKCQCCAEPGPMPTCEPLYKPALITDNQCPEWKCVCDIDKCPVVKPDQCKYKTVDRVCCKKVPICKEDKTAEPCEDEIKVCKDEFDPVCGITCKKCEIQCKSCPKKPIPECSNCEEVIEVPSNGTCGGCCPKFKCVPKVCSVHPTVACDSCHSISRVKDECDCWSPPSCVKDECAVEPLPNVTSCQKIVQNQDACNCTTYEVEDKPCEPAPTIVCDGPCDKVVKTKDICGCEKPSCVPHTCDPVVPKRCGKCFESVSDVDPCGCATLECERRDCFSFPNVTCDSCHTLVQPPSDECGCLPQASCEPKICPTVPTPECGDCQVAVESKDVCNCTKFQCEDIICPPYPKPNCSDCEHISDVITGCGCWEPKCVPNVCPTYPPPTCDPACEHPAERPRDTCGCLDPPTCVKNPCPTTAPVTCNKCQNKVSKRNLCGCVSFHCEPKKCPDYPDPDCGECFSKNKTLDDCDCPFYECKKRPVIDMPIPTCGPCDELVSWEGKCGEKYYSCKEVVCKPIDIPTCSSCQKLVNKTNPCGCLYFSECVSKDCPPVEERKCDKCHHAQTITGECGCKTKTCQRDVCKNYPSPNCTECQKVVNERDECDCLKQVCKERPCPVVPTPVPCDKKCEDLIKDHDPVCGCQTGSHCRRRPCPTEVPPTCNSCQKLKEISMEPCGCKKWICEDKPCKIMPSPNCSHCEEAFTESDGCGCSKQSCRTKPCPTTIPPTCSPCQKLKKNVDECDCNSYQCVERPCLRPTAPTCGKCQTHATSTGKCGCDIITCVNITCPPIPDLNCTECEKLSLSKGDCECETLKCEKKPCEKFPDPVCNENCEYIDYPENDKCGCPKKSKCMPYGCPTSPPPTCSECEELVDDIDDLCGCPVKVCKKKVCPDYKIPKCNECERAIWTNDTCGCKKPGCEPIPPPPTEKPPICENCWTLKNYTDKCGGKHYSCEKLVCTDDVPEPKCSDCEYLEVKTGACNCTIGKFCRPKECPQKPTPTCSDCEELKTKLGKCGCQEKVCGPKDCPLPPKTKCNKCEIIKSSTDKCNCSMQTCEPLICPSVPPPVCDERCFKPVIPNDGCCSTKGYCEPKPCPTVAPPKCSGCDKVVEKLTEPCGCKKLVCVPHECPKYEKPTCPKCFEADFEYDNCNCSKPVCKRKEETFPTPSTCPPCEKQIEYKDECNNTRYSCAKVSCKNVIIPKCKECKHLVKKHDDCGCLIYAECEQNPCPTTSPPACNSCEVPRPDFDKCGCKSTVCRTKGCPNFPPANCTDCQILKTETLECDCQKQICENKVCPTLIPPNCDEQCEDLVTDLSKCGCEENARCKRRKCPTAKPVSCNKCQKKVDKLTEPCGCKESVCDRKPCPSYPAPNCTICEEMGLGEDDCGCQQPICKRTRCPEPIPPTCPPCQKLHRSKSPCNCTIYECKPYCPVPVVPTCDDCQTQEVTKDSCGCDIIVCQDILCPEPPALNCTECEKKVDTVGKCGCTNSTCEKRPCKTNVIPTCNDLCEFVEYPKLDKCGCQPQPFCKRYNCPTSPPPTCSECEQHKEVFDDCGCKSKICDRKPCPNYKPPVCSKCQKSEFTNDSCGCPRPICVDIIFPTPVKPNCGRCEVLHEREGDCGEIIYECLTEVCKPLPPTPTCSPCQNLEKKISDCNCTLYEFCVAKPCKKVPTPTCSPCEELVDALGECGCPVKKCQKKKCPSYSANCTNCEYIDTIKDACDCDKQVCRSRGCPTKIPSTCSLCEHPVGHKDECGCDFTECERNVCPTEAPPTCDPVCEELVDKTDRCGCEHSVCEPRLCQEPEMPECDPCQQVVNETDQCGCLSLTCKTKKCPAVTPAPCKECERSEKIEDSCGCAMFRCVPVNHTDECVINGVAHKIGSSWANPFDPHCSKCHCVEGGKCLGARIDCEPIGNKDCVVFCKEGEWYYPPTKEQCAKTCGPCCGRCDKPQCNKESNPIPSEKTVGLLVLTKSTGRVPIKCTNKEQIHGLMRCSGACGLAHSEAYTKSLTASTCKCCKPTETEKISVRLTCEDGTMFNQLVKNPKDCQCIPCEVDHGGRK